MEQTVKILDVREFPSSEPTRIGKFDMVVTYQLDAFRTYLVTIPKEKFSELAVREAIKAQITEKEAWIGKEIKIT